MARWPWIAIIFLEYDNKGYMNTGGQLCYTGIFGQRNSNAPVGSCQIGKQTPHKDIVEILRGTNAPYLFQAAESHPNDMIDHLHAVRPHHLHAL